ncbi:hypothetical protein HG531_006917 [Fusarium graminearum]|nr:hypothetical protein HG531_006917 [Fusarium graminearum]
MCNLQQLSNAVIQHLLLLSANTSRRNVGISLGQAEQSDSVLDADGEIGVSKFGLHLGCIEEATAVGVETAEQVSMLDVGTSKSLKEGNDVLDSASIVLEVDILLDSGLEIGKSEAASNLFKEPETFVEQASRLVGLKRLVRSALKLFLGLESHHVIWATEAAASPSQGVGNSLNVGTTLYVSVNNGLDEKFGQIFAICLREELFSGVNIGDTLVKKHHHKRDALRNALHQLLKSMQSLVFSLKSNLLLATGHVLEIRRARQALNETPVGVEEPP